MKERNTGVRSDSNRVLSSFSLLFFFVNVSLFAQIDIDGLVVTSRYTFPSDFTSFILLDYNKDNITDIAVVGKNSKEYILLKGKKDFSFDKPSTRFFFYPVNAMGLVRERARNGNVKLFMSRPERIAGLAAFTPYGTLQLLTTIVLDSYPDDFIIDDFDKDGKEEAVVFGINFNGLELLREERLSIKHEKIVERKVYKTVKAIDLDYDGYKDLIAFNVIDNVISIFLNDRAGNFFQQRFLTIPDEINDFCLEDPNNDGFTDIVVFSEESISAFRGDSVYSFGNLETLLKNVNAKFLNSSDFNNDEIQDLIIFDQNEGALELYLGNDNPSRYDIYKIIEDSSITRIEKLPGKNRYLVFSSRGYLYLVEKMKKGLNNRFYPGHDYQIVNGASNNQNTFMALYDTLSNQAIMYSMNNSAIPEKYYESELNYEYNRLTFFNTGLRSNFILWRYGENVVEVFTLNNEQYINREFVYTRLPIKTIDAYASNIDDNTHLILYGGTDRNVSSESISLNRKPVEELPLSFVDSNLVAILPSGVDNHLLYAWKLESDSLHYYQYKPANISTYAPIIPGDVKEGKAEVAGFFNLDDVKTLTLFRRGAHVYPLIFEEGEFRQIKIKGKLKLDGAENFRIFNVGAKKLLTCEINNKLFAVVFIKDSLAIGEIKSIELNKIYDYFVTSINSIPTLVFIDQDYFVNITELDEIK